MKKKLILLSTTITMAIGVYFITNATSTAKNNLVLQNIEALSAEENPYDYEVKKQCYYSPNETCMVLYNGTWNSNRNMRWKGNN